MGTEINKKKIKEKEKEEHNSKQDKILMVQDRKKIPFTEAYATIQEKILSNKALLFSLYVSTRVASRSSCCSSATYYGSTTRRNSWIARTDATAATGIFGFHSLGRYRNKRMR